MSPSEFSLGYVLEERPIRWSFVPANHRTLERPDERFGIGTLVVPELPTGNRGLTRRMAAKGLVSIYRVKHGWRSYLVHRRARAR